MTNVPLEKDIRYRIALIRYPMIYLIVAYHVPSLRDVVYSSGVQNFIGAFFYNGLVKVGVPMLTCISGFLIFHKGMDQNFPVLIRKRATALLLPMVIWNLPFVLAFYIIQSQGLVAYNFSSGATMYPFSLEVWLNAVFSVNGFPMNYPLHFLRDLFLVSLLVPLIAVMIRNFPFIGLLIMAGIFLPNLDGSLFRTDTIPVTFYLGAMAAATDWDTRCLDRYAGLLIGVLLLLCTLIVVLDAGSRVWLALLAPFVIWPASSLIVNTRVGRWLARLSMASIFLFFFHGLAIMTLNAVIPEIYAGEYAFYAWLATPVLIALMSQVIYVFIGKYFPGFLTLLMGVRTSPIVAAAPTRS